MGSEGKSFGTKARGVRDSALAKLAKVTLAWTTTSTYQATTAFISRPALLVAALVREATESASSSLLAKLNMPSRKDVLALAQRFTRLEMVLDDVGAGLDELRRASSRAAARSPAARTRNSGERAANGATPKNKAVRDNLAAQRSDEHASH